MCIGWNCVNCLYPRRLVLNKNVANKCLDRFVAT